MELALMPAVRILIVGDVEDNRRILAFRLRKLGDFDIHEAENGIEALKVLEQSPPDLILLDLRMPLLDGWETARRIRVMEGEIRTVPIIAVTAQAMPGDEDKALACGCDAYLPKPIVDWRVVKEQIDSLLEHRVSPGKATAALAAHL